MADLDSQRPLIPHPGVDARSWLGFEQRIKNKRFDALLTSANAAIAAGNAALAAHALEEAREIRSGAPELAALETAIRSLQPEVDPRVQWRRARGAIMLLAAGVLMVMALDVTRLAPGALRMIAPPPPDLLHAMPVVALHRADAVTAATYSATPVRAPSDDVEVTTAVVSTPIAVRHEPVEPVPTPPRRTTPSGESRVTVAGAADRVQADRAAEIREDAVVESVVATAPVRGGENPRAMSSAPLAAAPSAPSSVASTNETAPPDVEETRAPRVNEQSRVADVLNRYARAYGDLDVAATREIWPDVDQRALTRAFESLASQTVSFDDCEIDVSGAIASASCRGQASYVGKVGRGVPRSEARTWRFQLRRDGETWKIATAEARGETH
jgi:hypothetical protein